MYRHDYGHVELHNASVVNKLCRRASEIHPGALYVWSFNGLSPDSDHVRRFLKRRTHITERLWN